MESIYARTEYGFVSKPIVMIDPEPERLFGLLDLFWIIPLILIVVSFFAFVGYFYWLFPEQAIAWLPFWIIALLFDMET